ncbi:MAG TPA: TPM domain-containing protein [Thermoanaerobaculia bacterium]|nr:TPM domain-containing protein [Thermoanaerobaculia bacterium]
MRTTLALLLAAVVAMGSASPLMALEIPPAPTQWVTDRAAILSAADLAQLNDRLRAFEERSGAQFIIYTFASLEEEALEDFTIRAAEQWKVGQKKYDNGVILFVFVKERKIRWEVAYGLEGALTDAFTSDVTRNAIAPGFQQNDYAAGLKAAADQIIARVENKEAPVPRQRPAQQTLTGNDIIPLIVILLIFFFVLGPMFRRGGRRGGGGCVGCIPLPMGGGGITFGGGGFGGGGFGGGGFGGGGFGGGGFGGGGGFSGGGGSFGGGGSSGGW